MQNVKLTGSDAIAYARAFRLESLSKHADPSEGERHDLTIAEAIEVNREDSSLVYVTACAAYGFDLAGEERGVEMVGHQDGSNTLDTIDEADAEIENLAKVLGVAEDKVEVVRLWFAPGGKGAGHKIPAIRNPGPIVSSF